MDEIALARHGESETSAHGIVGGDAPLTEAGRDQARDLARWLRDFPLEICIASTARRARETAEIAVEGRGIPVETDADLGEIGFGCFEGDSLVAYRAWVEQHAPDEARDGGETRVATLRRFARAFRRMLARPERHALVVAHGLTIRSVLDVRPRPIVADAAYGRGVRITHSELEAAVGRLETWCEAPAW
jgi:broad specificity phosphatase PhoE